MTHEPAFLPHRCVLRLTGPDTLTFLERLVTCNTTDWPAGEARYGALLTPQGKVLGDFLALRTPEGVWLDTDRAEAPALAKRLQLFRLRSQLDIEIEAPLQVWALTGPDPVVAGEIMHRFRDPRHPLAAPRAIVRPGAALPSPDSEPLAAYHADRIRLGLPEQGRDFTSAEVFPADINMDRLGGIDLKKGCFVGQEVVSRMHRRGTIRKRSVILQGDALVPGCSISGHDRPLGRLTSAAAGCGLGRLRLDRLTPGMTDVRVGDSVAVLAGPDWLEAERAALTPA